MAIVRREASHVARFVSEPDGGIYDAMNKGLGLATGDTVGFLNSDDMLADTGSVEAIAAGFDGTEVDAVYGDIVMVDPVQLFLVRRYWRPGASRGLRAWLDGASPHAVRAACLAAVQRWL